jgi:hypothetical protein
MRIALALIGLAFAGAAPALETARALAGAGAPQLALARVERLQPSDTSAARWGEWEELRLGLLTALARHEDALKRAAALPAALSEPVLRRCLLAAARAAMGAGRGAAARAYAARVLWALEAPSDEARAARLIVIDSHLADRQGVPAFHAMLRYDQDYRPLDRAMARRFVEQLLELGLDHEAVNWLAALDDQGALKLHLRLRARLIEPKTAIAEARARLHKADDARYWRVLAEAAANEGNLALRVEALERLLQGHEPSALKPERAAALWQAYFQAAESAANEARLLGGDDRAWLDLAARRLEGSPPQGRALYARLSREAAAPATRLRAQSQLTESLERGGLARTALHLFGQDPSPEALDTETRYRLGRMAEAHSAPALAVRFWQGLPPPADTGPEEWLLRMAAVQWQSGTRERALDTVRTMLKQEKPLPEPAAVRAVALARDIATASPGSAAHIYAALLPRAGRGHARDILTALGGIEETAGRHAAAADYFMRAALHEEARTDVKALRARLSAAANLARAGYRQDARAQFQYVVDNTRDPALLDIARRELGRL